MHRFLLAAALLLLPACAGMESPSDRLTEFAWSETCQLIEEERDYTCAGVAMPKVKYESMRPGLYGYYDGGDTVYVNRDLARNDRLTTLIHEMIHFVHVQQEMIPIPGPAVEVCWSENEAWLLEGIYSGKDNTNWWISYTHCWPYYDPEWEAWVRDWFFGYIEDRGETPEDYGIDPEEFREKDSSPL